MRTAKREEHGIRVDHYLLDQLNSSSRNYLLDKERKTPNENMETRSPDAFSTSDLVRNSRKVFGRVHLAISH
jgi:hypothetical protein